MSLQGAGVTRERGSTSNVFEPPLEAQLSLISPCSSFLRALTDNSSHKPHLQPCMVRSSLCHGLPSEPRPEGSRFPSRQDPEVSSPPWRPVRLSPSPLFFSKVRAKVNSSFYPSIYEQLLAESGLFSIIPDDPICPSTCPSISLGG